MPIAASTAQARNAAWKPSFSTTSGSAPSFAARNCSERVRATVVTMATPSAAPIWGGVAEARHEPGLALGDAREGGDCGGYEGGAEAGAVDE